MNDVISSFMTTNEKLRPIKNQQLYTSSAHEPTYEMSFNTSEPIDTDDLMKILGLDSSKKPDTYDIQYIKFVQIRRHKKKRINKKWAKRYGYKQVLVDSKGWKIQTHTDGTIEFVK